MAVTEHVRHDFPLYQTSDEIIYFDNACATLKPESVLMAMDAYNREFPTCGGRSINRLGERVTRAVESARSAVARFINAARPEEIVFVRNTTEGINLLAHTLKIGAGQVILTTDKEHNSNLVPWQQAATRTGAQHIVVPTHFDGTFDMDAYERLLQGGEVAVVAMGYTSNLDGVSIPAREVVEKAHQYGAICVLDAAQAAPHHALDMQALDVDFLVFSGHKLCGPSGTGVVYGKYHLLEALAPFIVGGSTVSESTYAGHTMLSAPEKFEGGTQDYAGIIGLEAAITYVDTLGVEAIGEHIVTLNQYATDALMSLPGLRIIGPPSAALRSGILSCTIEGVDIHQVAISLDQVAGVQVRSGQHCVHSWFMDRGMHGSVRLSFYVYNTTEEIDRCVEGLQKVIAVYT